MAEDQLEIEIEETNDDWGSLDPKQSKKETPKVEYEIEDEPEQVVEVKTKTKEVDKDPKELEGIETQGAKKRIRQLIKQRKDREDEIVKREARIKELEQKVAASEAKAVKTAKANMDVTAKQVEDKISSAQKSYRAALESEDNDAIVAAQSTLSQSQAELLLVKQSQEAFKDFDETPETKEDIQVPKESPAQYDPKAVAWSETNTWFGEDKVLTAAALHIDAQLKAEGFDPSDDEFYDEVDQRLRETYPSKFDVAKEETKEVVEKTQTVAGGSRTTAPTLSSGGSRKVKLTQEDVARAKKWGIPLDRYAASKLEVDAADGEYSTINTNRGGN